VYGEATCVRRRRSRTLANSATGAKVSHTSGAQVPVFFCTPTHPRPPRRNVPRSLFDQRGVHPPRLSRLHLFSCWGCANSRVRCLKGLRRGVSGMRIVTPEYHRLRAFEDEKHHASCPAKRRGVRAHTCCVRDYLCWMSRTRATKESKSATTRPLASEQERPGPTGTCAGPAKALPMGVWWNPCPVPAAPPLLLLLM